MGFVGQFFQQLRYALRQMRRHPGFALTAILTLALGIGATTAVFSVVEQMLLKPLPYRNAERIVAIETRFTDRNRQIPRVPGGDYMDVRASSVFSATAWYEFFQAGMQLPDHATFTHLAIVSPQFFKVFGAEPKCGALFKGTDAFQQALVSQAFADVELGGVSQAVGRTISVEGKTYEVVGVMPPAFDYPQQTMVWLGAPEMPDNLNRDSYNYRAVGLLAPSVSLRQAQVELDALSSRLAQQFSTSHDHVRLYLTPLRDAMIDAISTSLWLWLAAVGVLLLIACANVAHLQLVRTSAQGHALAVRRALGASRSRIVAGVLMEATAVSAAGGIAGLLLSIPATQMLMRVLSTELPRTMSAMPDPRLLLFCILTAGAVTLLSAALPCWWAGRRDSAAALSRDTRSGSGDRRSALWRRGLLTVEIGLSFLLVTTAGLLLRTVRHLEATPLGFSSQNSLVVYAHAPARTQQEFKKRVAELAQITNQLRVLPGVTAAAQTVGLPAGQYGSYAVVGKGPAWGQPGLPNANFALAGPGYFTAMNIPLIAGRPVTIADTETSQPAAVISESLARQSFGTENPLGRQILFGWDESTTRGMTIVGVVGDVRQDSPASELSPTIYIPLAQHPYLANEVQIVLKTAVAPAALIPAVRARVQAADASIATKFTTMDDALAASMEPARLRGQLLTAFAALALALAAIGIYSVTSYSVAQQVREIGIRMALGADRGRVAREVMTAAARIGLLGIGLGIMASLAATRLLGRFLVGVTALDPISYGAAAAVLIASALLAALLPARRAASTDPMVALRTE